MLNTLVLLFAILPFTTFAARNVASIRHDVRIDHAKELMGPRYSKSVWFKKERKNMEKNILAIVKSRLPKKHKSKAKSVTDAIITEAARHNLDPFFLMAVISGESSFNPEAVGPVGEMGLMQIRPSTGKWMAKIIKAKWKGDRSLNDPIFNIKLGTAYLSWLRERFAGHGQLYLAAYNMGASSVRRALGRNIWPKDYPRHVMKRYLAFYKELSAIL
jgi:soluble lytic murein transglycosylase